MKIHVKLTRKLDGKSVEYDDEFADYTIENAIWMFEQGNYACDCNRSLFFFRESGEQEPDDVQCSHGLFGVELSAVLSGDGPEVFYED